MNEMECLERKHVGSLSIKDRVGPNLLRGLVISVMIHSALISLPVVIGLISPPDTAVRKAGPSGPIWVDPAPPQPRPPRTPIFQPPQPKKPEIVVFKPDTVETVVDTSVTKPKVTTGGSGLVGKVPNPDDFGDWGESGGGGSGDPTAFIDDPIPPDTVFIPFEIEPVPIPEFCLQPSFPDIPKTAGMNGKVTIKVWVDRLGHVKKWKIVQATPPDYGFEDEVLKVVPQWRFTPAIQQGRAVGVWVAVPFTFKYTK